MKNMSENLLSAQTRQNKIKPYVKRMQNSHDVLYTRNLKSIHLYSLSHNLLDAHIGVSFTHHHHRISSIDSKGKKSLMFFVDVQ